MKRGYYFYRLLEKISFIWILECFVIGIFAFAVVYYLLTSFSDGLVKTYSSEGITFLDSLYFSIVTISSLGYGDFRPIGIARLLAALEVVFGLMVLGIAIAKISSERQSFLIKRLYSSDHRDRVNNHRKRIQYWTETLETAVSKSIPDFESIGEAILMS